MKPSPAEPFWPYLNHRTMEQVMRREAALKVACEAKRLKRLYRSKEAGK
jgi:Zn/Cd-binding protein ZinT